MPTFFGENLESPLTETAKNFIAEKIGELEPHRRNIAPLLAEARQLSDADRLYVTLCCARSIWYEPMGNGTWQAHELMAQVLGEIPLLPQAERPALYNRCVAIFDFDFEDYEAALAVLEREDNLPDVFQHGCNESNIRWSVARNLTFRAEYERLLSVMEPCGDEEAYNEIVTLLALRREIGYAARLAAQFPSQYQDRMMLPYETLLETLQQHNTPESVEATIAQLEELGVKVNRDYGKRWSRDDFYWP